MIYPVGGLLKSLFITIVNIRESLGIAIKQGKPAALNLHHDLVPLYKCMQDIVHCKPDLCFLIWNKRLRRFQAVSEFSAYDITSYKHLVATHRKFHW